MARDAEIKFFADPNARGLNSDDQDFAIEPNQIVNGLNIRTGTTDVGRTANIQSIGSNILLSGFQPSLTFVTVGTAEDTANRFVLNFKCCLTGPWHRIEALDKSTNTIYNVLLSSQVIGGLNFSKNSLIHSARVEAGILYWCEGTNNQPRRINIKRGIKMNHPEMYQDIQVVEYLFTGNVNFFTTNVIIIPITFASQYNFQIGELINISGSVGNDGTYTILNVSGPGNTFLTLSPPMTANGLHSVRVSRSLDVGIQPYVAPLQQEDITWIRPQPGLPLTVEKQTDVAFENNFIDDQAFKFCYRFISIEYETSTLSPLSVLINYNAPGDTFNSIDIEVPFGQTILQTVQQVDLVAKYENTGVYFVIKSWNRNIPSDLDEIEDHNNGITPLTFIFYNDFTGIALDSAYSVKPFDSLPLYAQTMEFARNRAFLANTVIGFDTPSYSPSTLSGSAIIQADGTDVLGQWVKIQYSTGGSATHYFVDIRNMTSGNGFYDISPQPSPPPFPDPVSYLNLTLVAGGPADFALYLLSHYPGWVNGIQYTGDQSVVTSAPFPPVGLTGSRCFKTQASYKLTTTFYDFAGRKCGITNTETVNIPDRIYAEVTYTTGITWALSNDKAINEIPTWAYYYSVDLTKCLRTRFFLQLRGVNAAYATKDADGNYLFTTNAYAATNLGCAFDITSLGSASMGYVFDPTTEDIIKIYNSTNVYQLKIVAQSGNWVVTELQNLGTLNSSFKFLFEIYTPYKPSTSEPYYEVGQIFKVTSPGTSGRTYSVLGGTIEGDVTLLTRNDGVDDYLTENMSPNDKNYQNWNTDSGRPNFVDTLGQVTKRDSIAYSNTIVEGTKNNGLCTFDALDVKDLPIECGAITKIRNTSKVNNEIGSVLVAICEKETVSLYIGESQLVATTGNAFIASAPDVIGTINILKGSFGTTHAESVIEYRGMLFWWDDINGRIIQYSVNGLFSISDYKMRRFWRLFTKQFTSMSQDEIEALGSRPCVFGGVDPYHDELLFAIPKLLENPPKGYLPDYPDIVYPFDIYDGQPKTMVYKLSSEGNSYWFSPFGWTPDYFASMENDLYSYKQGQTYLHNSLTSFNNFYGEQQRSQIMFVANKLPDKPKVYDAISIEENILPELVYFFNNYPIQQSSDLVDSSFNDLEGVHYAVILRNKLVPTVAGYTTDGLLTGEKMRNISMMCMIQWLSEDVQLELKFISILYSQSRGHTLWPVK